MAIRIISGTYRSRLVETPETTDFKSPVRPTKGRVRESAYNILASRRDLNGARVLDLFSGSGAAGLEALSRGAGHVTFVDTDLSWTRKNIESFKIRTTDAQLVQGDAGKFEATVKADIIFADPPYGKGLANTILARKDSLGHGDTLWLIEVETGFEPNYEEHGFVCLKEKAYGKSTLYLLTPAGSIYC